MRGVVWPRPGRMVHVVELLLQRLHLRACAPVHALLAAGPHLGRVLVQVALGITPLALCITAAVVTTCDALLPAVILPRLCERAKDACVAAVVLDAVLRQPLCLTLALLGGAPFLSAHVRRLGRQPDIAVRQRREAAALRRLLATHRDGDCEGASTTWCALNPAEGV